MAKYSEEFKIEIVREYLDGRLGFTSLAKKHNIKSKTQIRYWVNVYKKHGVTSLMRKKTNEIYSVQFKLDVLRLYEKDRRFVYRNGTSI